MDDLLEGVTWFGGSAVRIRREGLEIHVDPWGMDEEATADFVFLTHLHYDNYDNFSEEDVERVRGADTVVVAPASMKKQLGDADHFTRPRDMLQLGTITLGTPTCWSP